MDYSVKSIQAQQLYRVQPVSIDEKANSKTPHQQRNYGVGINEYTGKSYNPFYPSVENSPTLGKSLDLLG